MYHTIYIDIVFMTNFLMDYMLLRLVGKFLHLDVKRFRCMISAVFGSFVSCLLRFFYGGIYISSKKRRASCKNHPGNVPYSICSRRYLPGTGSRKNHDSKNISAFYGRDLRRSLHADVRGKFHSVRKKKHLSGNPEISGKNTAVLRLF